jgi:hypothetical protein
MGGLVGKAAQSIGAIELQRNINLAQSPYDNLTSQFYIDMTG